jgi:hypothetical protein
MQYTMLHHSYLGTDIVNWNFVFTSFLLLYLYIIVYCYVMYCLLEDNENFYHIINLFSKIYLNTNFQDVFVKDTDITVT